MTAIRKPAPASAEARATKVDRVQYLEAWALENPLATNDQAREAVRARFSISLGTSIISETMRGARQAWENQRRLAIEKNQALTPPVALAEVKPQPQGLRAQIDVWARDMKSAGIRLIEILPDGGVRFELTAL